MTRWYFVADAVRIVEIRQNWTPRRKNEAPAATPKEARKGSNVSKC